MLSSLVKSDYTLLNLVQDFFYKYGFTEKAFNFQTENFGKGGGE